MIDQQEIIIILILFLFAVSNNMFCHKLLMISDVNHKNYKIYIQIIKYYRIIINIILLFILGICIYCIFLM
ncbi:hypothetical protein SAMN02745151_00845 [[Clostridium] propionicum DSM 1682]|uniref:Uncharacterized protein n=1 Tax=Anaerotignum propionicum DSM 1682 TaxID=991789 RepID=A0A0X8V8T7_ANAPI|nr:hypothetical protein CPRO_06330 [Anaerotignum propionicum DSM 1682]SHE46993.1 hypothetical protein SAMN02745151_00845 [[Clostridium] propionicum DSM 1682] [Anaerotignum propionicum DSM 1682]